MRTKLDLSEYSLQLIATVGRLTRKTEREVLDMLLFEVETLARHEKLDSLSLVWREAAHITNVATAMGAQGDIDPIAATGKDQIDFDVALLETAKTRSGFAGVYPTGSSFRALVPDNKGGNKYLPSRSTAVEAAIERYKWFEEYGIPYGNIGKHFAEAKLLYSDYNDEQLLVQVCKDATMPAKSWKYPITSEAANKTLMRYRERNGIPPEGSDNCDPEATRNAETLRMVETRRERLRLGLPLPASEQRTCAVCKDKIEDGRLAFVGTSNDPAHPWCLDFNGQPMPVFGK